MGSSTMWLTIAKPIVKTVPPSRIFLAISLIVVNFCVRSVSGVDQNTSFVLDSWVNDNEGKYSEIISSCSDKCVNEDIYYGNLQGIGCQPYKDLCSKGCNQWNLSTFSTCKQVCHDDTWQRHVSPCDLACISGCNSVVAAIMDTLKQHEDFRISPVVVEGTINGTSLMLSWPIVQKTFSTERLVLQYSYAESSTKWRYSSNFQWLSNYTCLIEKLQPHTKYRFRIAMMVTTDHSNFVYSAESGIILTMPEGVPFSAPEITNVISLDHETIAVFWKQGRFINGPLQGYKIIAEISDANDNTTIEVTADPADDYTILPNLNPGKSYDVEVSMMNSFGNGPAATTIATTANIAAETPNPAFIIAGDYTATLLNTSSDGFTATELYRSDHLILGFSVSVHQQTMFVSDDSGHVYRINMNNKAERDAILSSKSLSNAKPSKISIDWLNSFLYIIGEIKTEVGTKRWLIARTGFAGNGLVVISQGLLEKPVDLQVDVLNGFLFWITSESGLFRLDLADTSSRLIYQRTGLNTFTIDPKRFLISSYSDSDLKFIKITYDGKFAMEHDLQMSVEKIVDMVNHDSRLFWTDGSHIYSNQSVSVLHENCQFLTVFHSSAQATPSPTKSPQAVQALMTADKAKISWKPPPKGYFQSAAAWADWSYDVEVTEGEVSVTIRNIKTNVFTVEKLKPNTEYKLRVRASTLPGRDGPWSEGFQARTWSFAEARYILWASESGLLRTNEAGDDLQVVLNGSVSGLTWANGSLLLVKDSGLGRLDESKLTEIFEGVSAECLSYDWKGEKIYFADKLGGALTRMSLDGSERELLPIFGVRHMELDSENGFIYYSTELRIEACSLNGRECMTYYRTSLFSEEDLLGPALDLKNGRVYWMTQSDQESFLFSATMAHERIVGVGDIVLTPLEGFPAVNLFSYADEKLIWSINGTTLAVANAVGDHQALLPFRSKINEMLVLEPAKKRQSLSNVIPDTVDNSTIKTVGFWDTFNITWEPVETDGSFNISYSIQIGDNVFLFSVDSSVQYPRTDLPPYSPLKVWITSASPWSSGSTSIAELFSPTAAPSEPKRLKVFINRVHDPLQGKQNVSAVVRWDPPLEPNGPIVLYSVDCQEGNNLVTTQNSTTQEATFWDLQENTTYSFQVQAFTSGSGGVRSEIQEITVNSKFQSIPKLLVAESSQIEILDIDLNSTEVLTTTNGTIRGLVTIREENRVFWVDESGQLMSYFNDSQSVLSNLDAESQALTVDWITRIIYWSQVDHGGGSTIHYLDLNQFEEKPLSGQLLISNPKPIKDLIILPLSQTLLWLNVDGSLNGWNLRELTEMHPLTGENSTYQSLYSGSFEEDQESVILVDERQRICVLDLRSEKCNPLKIGVDLQNLHIAWDNGFIYTLKNDSIRAYNRRKQSLEYMVHTEGITQITALSFQPYPEVKCLLPDFEAEPLIDPDLLLPQLVNSTNQSLQLRFPRISAPPECGFKVPGLRYTLVLEDRMLHSFDPQLNVTDLKPFTKYTFHLHVSNYYADKLSLAAALGPQVAFMTAPGAPSVPRNISVSAVSPRDGLVEWMHPEILNNYNVWYELHWQTENPTNGVVHRHQTIIPEGEDDWNSFLLSSLRPNHEYSVWIKVFSTETLFNTSEIFNFKTFPEPTGLVLVDSAAYNLTVSWNSSAQITSAFLLYSPLDVDDTVSVNITLNSNARVIESLEPKTKYIFHLKLFYSHSVYPYVWPTDNRFVFETLGDRPGAPGQPMIKHIKGEIFKIFWEPANNNGAPIVEYTLEALQSSNTKRVKRSHFFAADGNRRVSNKTLARLGQLPWVEEIEPIQDKWISYYKGSETSCIISDLHTMRLLMFRGRARNSYGWGPYSVDSDMIAEPFVSPRKRDTLVFAIIAPITIVSTCVSMAMLIQYIHGRRKHAKKLLNESRTSIWGLDVATLQQVARSRNFSQTSSMLYTGKPLTDGDIALLPQMSRGQITMQKFLGSGAFGEVYEGLVTYTADESQDRVAIKTLRKGATEQEKTELLQEAHLMSHFKHENIVKLIGVCFDLDSICIIMELMEGGDLQTYLRMSRPTFSKLETLSLLDLVGMCLDVCTGCRYLEDLHFLHRDLACRNCLVSSTEPEFRVVKIGDFGLARDIYKSDYYRKEGEGLLPVRWMAPECLVDGVFTSQSDIWSFGVLLWEILSLGQQPYPAQSNLEVLNFVKEGGRLQQPEECPDKLYKLMMECWNHNPEERPTFQRCLSELLAMKLDILNRKHAEEHEEGITNFSFMESDRESISKVSVSSRDDKPEDLNSFVEQVPDQRNHTEDSSSSELTSFRAPAENDANDGIQPKRKSVHYVNEGRSRF